MPRTKCPHAVTARLVFGSGVSRKSCAVCCISPSSFAEPSPMARCNSSGARASSFFTFSASSLTLIFSTFFLLTPDYCLLTPACSVRHLPAAFAGRLRPLAPACRRGLLGLLIESEGRRKHGFVFFRQRQVVLRLRLRHAALGRLEDRVHALVINRRQLDTGIRGR